MSSYSNNYRTDRNYRKGDFVMSSIRKEDLKKYGIDMSVKDFKNEVKHSRKYKVIVCGNAYRECHTKVYNYEDFTKRS